MKTTTDLFLAFTSNRVPTIVNASTDVHPGAEFFFISDKQSNWLSSVIFKKVSSIKGGELSTTQQYQEKINGKTYCLIVGKRTRKIRVTNY